MANSLRFYWYLSLFSVPVLLLLSHFSHIWLCATPEMAAHQAPPSLGFSRQEHWSGLPFPSPMHESESEVAQSCPTQRPHRLQRTRLLHPWDFPGKSTGVGCHCPLRPLCIHDGISERSKRSAHSFMVSYAGIWRTHKISKQKVGSRERISWAETVWEVEHVRLTRYSESQC